MEVRRGDHWSERRETRIMAAALDYVLDHPEHEEGDRFMFCIVSTDRGEQAGAMGFRGYEDPEVAVTDAMHHLQGLCQTLDLNIAVIPVNKG